MLDHSVFGTHNPVVGVVVSSKYRKRYPRTSLPENHAWIGKIRIEIRNFLHCISATHQYFDSSTRCNPNCSDSDIGHKNRACPSHEGPALAMLKPLNRFKV